MNELIGMADRETDQDSLDIERYVDGFASFVKRCDTPMSIAVQGDWGTGKSSFMNLVENKIKNEVTVIRFNTWQYSRVEDDRLFLPMLKVLTGKIDEAYLKAHPTETGEEPPYDGYFKQENGKTSMTFSRDNGSDYLITLPKYMYCNLLSEVTLEHDGETVFVKKPDLNKEYVVTNRCFNYDSESWEFYCGEEMIFEIKDKGWTFDLEQRKDHERAF